MGLFRFGKKDASAAKAGEEDTEELQSAVADPRGIAGERPSGTSERRGAGRSLEGELGPTASGQDGRERRKKSDRRERGASEDLTGGGGATGSGASASQASSAEPRGGGGGMPVASSVNDFISKTKNQRRKGLKPSGPELIAYARYLGIDPVADHDLLWIAVEALEAPLPSTWSEHFDSNDRVFYYNASTRVSSWTHPLEHVYRETYTTIVNFRNSNLSVAERAEKLQKLQAECEQMETDVHREISLWTEHHDEQGHRFYFNAQEKQSTWTDPRPAQCHILYLKMKLVRVLSACAGVSGIAAAAAAQNSTASQGGEASRFAPSISGASPRRERESNGGGGGASDLGGKRAKVGSGSVEPVDQFPRRGLGALDGPGSARAESDAASALTGLDEGWADAEDDRNHHKRKKEKKHKKKREFADSGDERGAQERSNLNHSQSEPAGMSKREAAPPPGSHDEARGMGGGPYPAVPHNFPESGESLSSIGRARVKAGIRLQPLQPISGGPSAAGPAATEASGVSGLYMSSSVPELKPLEKLQPLVS